MSFELHIVTPKAQVYTGLCKQVDLPGKEGRFGVLEGHMGLVATLEAGVVEVHLDNGSIQKFAISEGIADVSPQRCVLLVERAVAEGSVNVEALSAERETLIDKGDEASADLNFINVALSL